LQFGRAQVEGLSLRFIFELLGGQVGLLTPFVFVLSLGGLWLGISRGGEKSGDATLFLVSLIGPLLAYFFFHSLHARVHGNWIAPAYPVLEVLGAEAAFEPHRFPPRIRGVITLSRRLAVPVGLAFAAIAYLQAVAAPIPLDPAKDPTALMAGWAELAQQVEEAARKAHASYILTSHYVLTSELSFYSSDAIPIIEYNERMRWLSFGDPPPSLFEQRGLYVVEADRDESSRLSPRFQEFERIGELSRKRGGKTIASYIIYAAARPVRPVLD